MFDIGADEILLTTVVAIVAIGPKELPRALRLAGHWIGRFRRMSGAFRSGIETMIREAEVSALEQNWQAGRESVIEHLAEQERQRQLAAGVEPSSENRSANDQQGAAGRADDSSISGQGTIQSPSATNPPAALGSNFTT